MPVRSVAVYRWLGIAAVSLSVICVTVADQGIRLSCCGLKGIKNDLWPDIHMTPDEGVRAHLDLQGPDAERGVLLPIHWGTFNLAPHPWAEPGEWTKDAAGEAGQTAAFPRPGEPFEPAGEVPGEAWWRAVSPPIAHPWRRPRSTEGVVETSRGDLDLAGER
ncbi:hypothetical protein ACH49_26115 [Streptomyces leeuwenhoekii]|uniref:Metallo-beta-lactamase domain-containing protein n=1 Tax=Streptomyces leeuwenhoekii TaxID=1437453 RepID=A0ABR5HS61_STRLW|nr:hypothetical protein ACH49_26115 [Streptomyces leeuwenhoekii]